MTDDQRKHFEQRLLEERAEVLENLEEFDDTLINQEEGDGDLTRYPLHMADEGTDTMEQEKEYLLASNEGRQLYRIDDALRTLYKEPDRYGRCQECGREIDLERLEVVPWATLCIDHERASEEEA